MGCGWAFSHSWDYLDAFLKAFYSTLDDYKKEAIDEVLASKDYYKDIYDVLISKYMSIEFYGYEDGEGKEEAFKQFRFVYWFDN